MTTTHDRTKNSTKRAKGILKEAIGKVTRDHDLQAAGKADQVAADLQQAFDSVKDAFSK